ncbi:MAG: hypothetical protein DCC57_12410 [Chloroflexi bacterium]|nr:MAG: hypothetical protein DCC57_12410 [Chloroflexota bacterium]
MKAPKRAMKYLKYGLTAAVVLGLAVAAFKYLQGGEVLAALRAFHGRYMPLMLLSALAALLLKSWRFQLLIQAVYRNISWKIPWKVFLAGQPALMLPGGAAAQVGLMKQAGADVGRSSAPVVTASLLDQTVLIVGSLLAALWFEPARTPVLISLAVIGLLALLLWWKPARAPIFRWARNRAARFKLGHSLDNFAKVMPTLMAPALLAATLGITLVSHLLKFSILVLAAWGLGVEASYGSLFLAFVVPSLLGRFTPLPAGIGVVDASMVGFLAVAAQLNTNQAAALVALFRVVMIFLPVVAGSVVYFLVWRGAREAADRTSMQPS